MYVVSSDVSLLIRQWCRRRGFFNPASEFYKDWRKDFAKELSSIFLEFEFVDEEFLQKGINNLTADSCLPLISLDPVYFDPQRARGRLDFTRLVDINRQDRGMAERQGSPSSEIQFRKLQEAGESLQRWELTPINLPLIYLNSTTKNRLWPQ